MKSLCLPETLYGSLGGAKSGASKASVGITIIRLDETGEGLEDSANTITTQSLFMQLRRGKSRAA